MSWTIHFGEWFNNIIYRLNFVEIIDTIIIARSIVRRRMIGEIPNIIDMDQIARKCDGGKYCLIDRPIPVERGFLRKPPSKSNRESNEQGYQKDPLEYIPEGFK